MRNLSPPEFSNVPSCHSAQPPLLFQAPGAWGVAGRAGVVAMISGGLRSSGDGLHPWKGSSARAESCQAAVQRLLQAM